jgi:hypothetical protein
MCTFSFVKETLNITIHNQHSSLELASPVYFSNGTTCHVFPSQQIDAGTTMEASFGIDSKQGYFEGVLLYKLQKKHATGNDSYSNSSVTSANNTETSMYILVVWKFGDYNHIFSVCLIECDDDFTWDEDKLWALSMEYNLVFQMYYTSNLIAWLMHDGTVMKTRFDITYGLDCKLNIFISEGTGKYMMSKPMKIDPKRLVMLLSILIVLIYAISLFIEPSFKLSIHNQCSSVDLVSPIYVTYGCLECHRAPNHKVYAGNMTRSSFIIYDPDYTTKGALIYRLQRKQKHESTEINEDTSSDVYLLVVGEIHKSKKLCASVLLVKYDKKFDRNDLKELQSMNSDRFKLSLDSTTETWSLYGNIALMTTSKIMNEYCILNITISEVERDNNTRMAVHIDPTR